MQDLANRIANLEATAKSWEIVTLSNGTFDSKFIDYNFAIIEAIGKGGQAEKSSINLRNGNSLSIAGYSGTSTYFKSGNRIVCSNGGTATKVLFYK